MVADQLDYVVGVDPHRDQHALGVVEVRSGVRRNTGPDDATTAKATAGRTCLGLVPETEGEH